jgi:hypothetical protein
LINRQRSFNYNFANIDRYSRPFHPKVSRAFPEGFGSTRRLAGNPGKVSGTPDGLPEFQGRDHEDHESLPEVRGSFCEKNIVEHGK